MKTTTNCLAAAFAAAALAPAALAQLPPTQTDAGGRNVPNIGVHDMKKTAAENGGRIPSGGITLLPGTVLPNNPKPLGWVLTAANLYLPDTAEPGVGDQAALNATYALTSDDQYPLDLDFSNSDPSGSIDNSAVDVNGDPIHFNLHWPQGEPDKFWLTDVGLEPNSPVDDLEEIVNDIYKTGNQSRVQEALDILLGTNVSGALTNRAYLGFELLHYKGRKDNQTFDPVTRNLEITQLWYGNEIRSSHNMVKVPAHGDYTITWKIRGLGDPGPNHEFAFPIDEFTAIPMKKTANSLFWFRNAWVWKWFDVVDPLPGDVRKYSLEQFFQIHTGTPFDEFGQPVPSYADVNPGDARYWLYVNRKMDMGSYVGGQGDITSLTRFQQYDLDQDGRIGGYLANGTDTGLAYDGATNSQAQFNSYGNQEYAVPLLDWSQGPTTIPFFGYDSSFTTVRKGQGFDLTVRYGQGLSQAGIYVWGWREHPPRINWLESYAEGEILASGAPKDWRFGHKWDEVQALGVDAIGDLVPEKALHNALIEYGASAGTSADRRTFLRKTKNLMPQIADRRGLPATPGVLAFPNPEADLNLFYGNLDIWGDIERISAAGKKTWTEGDKIKVTIYNDDAVTRYFRVVDFGTTDYQYNGLDMGLLDWKPVFGFPQIAAMAWSGLFGAQGYAVDHWSTTALNGTGNPFYVDPMFADLPNFWQPGVRDLKHDYDDLTGFSGPGFHVVQDGVFSVWGNNQLASKPTGDANIWNYSYGKPIPPKSVRTFDVEMPRAAALNNGAMYIFDPQFHFTSIFTNHPVAELVPEGLGE
ncbi:hypothetical protein [Engelhardtia mirabilis]|uniref:Uncharacterized protein n=1 Tax=Engelhardtia mirabilis TaxID=2528011 RepID=A0A518BRJ7_9BACT|nr:hypothetical protein Pla133_47210 [Planctomycetes bacterium Pla133]QDV03927.1 hypothetical protein Pla86_47190 [Planctomycetes bacterium Pla86]